MKRKKPQHRIPWYCFDIPYDKPPTKGWWKNFKDEWKEYFGKDKFKRIMNNENQKWIRE